MANSAEEPKAVKLWFDYANNDSRSVQVRRVVAGIEKQHYPQYLAVRESCARRGLTR